MTNRIVFAQSICLVALIVVITELNFPFWPYATISRTQVGESLRKWPKENIQQEDSLFHAHPLNLNTCVTFRVRGSESTMVYPSNSSHIYKTFQEKKKLRIGFEFVDRPEGFVSFSAKTKSFHLFHFLEFLVVAMFHVLPPRSQQRLEAMPEISWVYTPLFTRTEICGVAGLNCKVLEILSSLQKRPPFIYGLEANDPKMLPSAHPGYSGQLLKRTMNVTSDLEEQAATYKRMVKEVDAIILVDRRKCQQQQQVNIHKIWTNYIQTFPSDHWHQLVQHALASQPAWPTDPHKLVTCYIDRQNTQRSLPDLYHKWLIQYLQNNKDIQFVHAFMEKMDSLDQIRLACSCQVLVGVHGNGLSHLFWMKPRSYVVELFWNFPYVYDYNTAAQLMQHKYLGLWDLDVLPFDTNISKLLEWHKQGQPLPTLGRRQHKTNVSQENLKRGKLAIQSFLQNAIREQGLH